MENEKKINKIDALMLYKLYKEFISLQDNVKEAKFKLIFIITELILWVASGWMAVVWFGWKLALILFLATWAIALRIYISNIRPLERNVKLFLLEREIAQLKAKQDKEISDKKQ